MKYWRWWSIPLLLLLTYWWLRHDANNYAIKGIDVSHYQGRIRWQELAATGEVDFVFIKATEGQSYTDSLFSRNWEATANLGVYRGAYHFFRANRDPAKQARHFIRQVSLELGDLAPVLDIEEVDEVPNQVLLPKLKTWLQIVEAHYGVKPILYASMGLYRRRLRKHFPTYPVWIARYARQAPPTNLDWKFWQYTDEGRLTGIDGAVDQNVFSGSWYDLNQLCLP